jgi:hypothetical protein
MLFKVFLKRQITVYVVNETLPNSLTLLNVVKSVWIILTVDVSRLTALCLN